MRRFRRTRSISVLIGILCVGLVSTSVGAPGDIFQSGAPILGGDAPSKADIAIGDATVSSQTGALQYGYPIAVPPGRAGLQPSISLAYTSQGSSYGSPVGAGWSLSGVHWIERDTRKGRLATDYGLNNRPARWTSSLTGGRSLVEVDEPRPAGSTAYRVADGDGSYVRYQYDGTVWRALTPDGLTHTFGETANMGGLRFFTRYPQTSTVDGFGNRIDYTWSPVQVDGEVVDFRLDRIEYTSHPEAAAFARVDFEYERPGNCPGSAIPVGAELDYRNGERMVRGADKLVAIRTSVRDPDWRTVREVRLDYYDDQIAGTGTYTLGVTRSGTAPSASAIGNTERCDAPFTPIRLLESVSEIGHTPPASIDTREGQRRWQYRYDADGNQVTRIAPVPDGATALDYTTSVVYDALGRPISKVTGRAGMSTANSALLGGGGYISYLYDEGPNGIGRLSFIRSFTDAGEELIEQSFAHDARGNVIENRVSFDLGPIGYPALADTRVVQQHHGASGQTTDVWYGDHPTKAGSSWVSHHYDRRGNLRQTYLETGPSGVLATNLRNVAGLVTAQSFGPTDVTWTYDSLGRVLEQKVEVESLLGSFGGGFPGGVVAAQTFDLHDSGDPRTLVNQLAGTQHTYAFQHDHQRQLVHAEGTDGFVQDLTYFQSGRIETNVVAAPTTPGHSVTPRDVVYEYGNQAESHQVTALLDEQGDDLARYTYDAAGNIVDRFVAGDHYQHVYDGYEDQRIVRRGGATELYFYDGGKQRLLALDLAGARLRLFHGPLEVHYDLNGNVDRTWAHVAHGATTIRIEDRTTREWTVHSALRHALVTLDHTGQPTAAFSYAPFGERLASLGDVESHPRRFNDKVHDDSSGLAYYGYRYYDPLAQIWTQADPLYRFAPDFAGAEPRRANLYSFVLNGPLTGIDPDGRNRMAGCFAVEGHGCGGPNVNLGDGLGRAITDAPDAAMAAAGALPVAGDLVDAATALYYVAKGDMESAAIAGGAALIPGVSYHHLKHADEVVEVGGKVIRGGDEAVDAAKATKASVPEPDGGFAADLSKTKSRSRSGHRNAGNKQLNEAMANDPALRAQMEARHGSDVVDRTSTSGSGRRNPAGTEWDHSTADPNRLDLRTKPNHAQKTRAEGQSGGGWRRFFKKE